MGRIGHDLGPKWIRLLGDLERIVPNVGSVRIAISTYHVTIYPHPSRGRVLKVAGKSVPTRLGEFDRALQFPGKKAVFIRDEVQGGRHGRVFDGRYSRQDGIFVHSIGKTGNVGWKKTLW